MIQSVCMSCDDALMNSPGNVTVSKVVGSVWSYDRQLLCSPFEALCSLDGDTLAPTYNCQVGSRLLDCLCISPPDQAKDRVNGELKQFKVPLMVSCFASDVECTASGSWQHV